MSRVDPFAVIHHPLEPAAQHLHIPLTLFLVSVLVYAGYQHSRSYLRNGTRQGKRTGASLVFMSEPMIASGYLI